MDILCCPECKGDLDLSVDEEKDGEIITGKLSCNSCKRDYPIDDAIPNMLIEDE